VRAKPELPAAGGSPRRLRRRNGMVRRPPRFLTDPRESMSEWPPDPRVARLRDSTGALTSTRFRWGAEPP